MQVKLDNILINRHYQIGISNKHYRRCRIYAIYRRISQHIAVQYCRMSGQGKYTSTNNTETCTFLLTDQVLNQACIWFLEIALSRKLVCIFVCLCVCVCPQAIKNHLREMEPE